MFYNFNGFYEFKITYSVDRDFFTVFKISHENKVEIV